MAQVARGLTRCKRDRIVSSIEKKKGGNTSRYYRPSYCCSGGRTRTCGLWVMSPTSYQLLHPASVLNPSIFLPLLYGAKLAPFFKIAKLACPIARAGCICTLLFSVHFARYSRSFSEEMEERASFEWYLLNRHMMVNRTLRVSIHEKLSIVTPWQLPEIRGVAMFSRSTPLRLT